uniref:Uncharacterized protein n=1 Tax=Oryza meridionalis TaxID=40149 RepID=A0A0E0F4M2_9ORYZ
MISSHAPTTQTGGRGSRSRAVAVEPEATDGRLLAPQEPKMNRSRLQACFATSWLSGSKISTTLLPFLLSGKLAFTQLSTVIEFMPPRITRYLLSCRKERSFLVISVSSPSDDSQHECALPNTSLPQYGNESLLWSLFMRKEMILQCPQVTIKSHQIVPYGL